MDQLISEVCNEKKYILKLVDSMIKIADYSNKYFVKIKTPINVSQISTHSSNSFFSQLIPVKL